MTQPPSGGRPGSSGSFPSVSKQIFRSDYFTILVDERMGIVRSIRNDKPFASIQELEACFEEVSKVLDGLERARYALIVDVRAAPGRNDPQFEAAMKRVRPRWIGGLRKVGVLVQSAVGVMQVNRYARQDGIKRLVSTDEEEILRYFAQED